MTKTNETPPSNDGWLTRYYLTRAAVSIIWVGLAFTAGRASLPLGMALLLAYPAWDSLANWFDAKRNGGLAANPTQALNAAISAGVAVVIAATLSPNLHAAVGVIGVWAALAGLLQLSTAARRWRHANAQWPMILSGAQSALAGTHFLVQASDRTASLSVATVAPYAAFGALYFALSGIILVVRRYRAGGMPAGRLVSR